MGEEFDDEEEMNEALPDMPNIISALEDTLKDFDDSTDWMKYNKKDLVTNIYNLYDMVLMLTKYVVAKSYKIDILDRAFAHHSTLEHDGVDEIEDIEMPDNVPRELYM